MALKPEVVSREAQLYVSIQFRRDGSARRTVAPLHDEIFGWLAASGIQPAGPPLGSTTRSTWRANSRSRWVSRRRCRFPATTGSRDICSWLATT